MRVINIHSSHRRNSEWPINMKRSLASLVTREEQIKTMLAILCLSDWGKIFFEKIIRYWHRVRKMVYLPIFLVRA